MQSKIRQGNGAEGNGASFFGSGSTFNEQKFSELLKGIGDGAIASYGGINVCPSDSRKLYHIGEAINGAVLDFQNAVVTAKAFSMIVNKLCDGCVVNMSGIKVTSEGLEDMYDVGERSDGTIFTLDGATLPEKALDLIYSKQGDGCAVYDQNLTVE